MSKAIVSLADYQDWLNTLKQRVQSASDLKYCLRFCQFDAGAAAAPFGQQPVDQILWAHWYVTGYES